MAEQVIDASVVLKWFVQDEPYRRQARQLLVDARRNHITLIGPPLLEYEVESNLQYRVQKGRMTLAAVNLALPEFYALGMQIYTHPRMIQRAREIARRFQQERIYDALYAALADLHGCEFWTADKRFYEAVRSRLRFVKYLANYA